jgi:hypothetical protein
MPSYYQIFCFSFLNTAICARFQYNILPYKKQRPTESSTVGQDVILSMRGKMTSCPTNQQPAENPIGWLLIR